MRQDKRFRVIPQMPKSVTGGMHPDTKKMIEQIKGTRGKVLACKFRNAKEAKNRQQAMRRAKSRGQVNFKEARRQADTVYFQLR